MFIILNRSNSKVYLKDKVIGPGKFVTLNNLEYAEYADEINDYLFRRLISIIYVPREEANVLDPYRIVNNPLFQRSVRSARYKNPPPDLASGDRFLLVPPLLYPEWQANANKIAEWLGGRWHYEDVQEGTVVWVEDEEQPYQFTSNRWILYEQSQPEAVQDIVEINLANPTPAFRFVTRQGELADMRDPTHATQVIGITLEETFLPGKKAKVKLTGVQELPFSITPGINLRYIYLWEDGTFKDIPPSAADGAVFCLILGKALSSSIFIIDIEPAIIYH